MGSEMALVTVVGAGPVGLRVAGLVAEQGFEATVLEEHASVGRPVQCAGLVSKTGLDELGLGLKEEDFVQNKVYGARIFSPNNTVLEIKKRKPVALVIDRLAFDRLLQKQATEKGAKVKAGTKVIDFRNSSLFLETKGHGEMIKSSIVVGADGANSVIRHGMHPGIGSESFIHSLQYRMEGSFDPKMVEVYFGGYAKGFFSWVVPESEKVARVGLGTRLGQDIEKRMKVFLHDKKVEGRILGKSSALIPIRQPLKEVSSDNTLLVGDAAFQAKATTGGGIVMGLAAAEKAAEAIAGKLKHGSPLKEYDGKIAGIRKELSLHWKIYSYIHSMDESSRDNLFAKAKKAGLEAFLEEQGDMDRPSRFVKKMMLKPRLWGLAPTLLRFAIG